MKKILLFSALVVMVAAACKKTPNNPNQTVTVSFPTVNPIQMYFSVPVGTATLPASTAIATAYDSIYRKPCTIVINDTSVHTSVPGLYQAFLIATSYYGYVTTVPYYVAVTQFSNGAPNLVGTYQVPGTTPLDSDYNDVTQVVPGIYEMDNYYAVNVLLNPGSGSTAIFAAINDTTIAFAGTGASNTMAITGSWNAVSNPPTDPGSDYYGVTGSITYATGDTTLTYGSTPTVYSKP